MPTVEQLYTLIGAKDGFIYDIQLQLQGLNQEYQQVKAERDELQEKLDKFNTPANVKPGRSTQELIESWKNEQPQPSMTSAPDLGTREFDETIETDEFKATFKP